MVTSPPAKPPATRRSCRGAAIDARRTPRCLPGLPAFGRHPRTSRWFAFSMKKSGASPIPSSPLRQPSREGSHHQRARRDISYATKTVLAFRTGGHLGARAPRLVSRATSRGETIARRGSSSPASPSLGPTLLLGKPRLHGVWSHDRRPRRPTIEQRPRLRPRQSGCC